MKIFIIVDLEDFVYLHLLDGALDFPPKERLVGWL